ncbi:excinuclease ABC subunit UvrC [Succinivibrio faecicola]|uniref:UvrABC system protein C n=1 Tax=Succinivibrio faecicola TaxID=2820300 RepID=A0ABS7DES2_9GAMM|nr:excinuclease ABC subunit UvrC [Succinivibrio faecicola]MBW7569360.1 excinuclease ABC subunit UvrC [Succinivibrio faecicola]
MAASISFDYRSFLKTVPNRPGSYQMYSDENTVIYVGKAKDLKKRLSSYFLKDVNKKTLALISHIHHIEFTITFSEAEALILENNLIKKYQPHYNILLRDDKSYPYLILTKGKHPALHYYRGKKRIDCEYFGPYPDAKAAKESLKLLQNLFPIRQCTDTVYKHRSRPCLMAQIGKCLAPCVQMSDEQYENYLSQVNYVRMFLKGQNQDVLNSLTQRMEIHSNALEFEMAAKLRDQLLALRRVQESQSVSSECDIDADVIATQSAQDIICNHVLYIRQGRIIASRSYLMTKNSVDTDTDEFTAFIEQYYLSSSRVGILPKEIITDAKINSPEVIIEAVKEQFNHSLTISNSVRLDRAKYLKLAKENANSALLIKLADSTTAKRRIDSLEKLLNMTGIQHMECYDISHTQGELTVASCVSFNREGPDTANYRRFNIDGITPGDDFAAMDQVLNRRFKNIKEGIIPDIIFIDGGKGQLSQAENVISKLFTDPDVKKPLLLAVTKGEGRKEGLETFVVGYTRETINLSLDDPAMQIVLHIRDESHRFAITGHRNRRAKARVHSALENIEGIGPKRRQALLKHLGGIREVMNASVQELSKVPSISKEMAELIYEHFHSL